MKAVSLIGPDVSAKEYCIFLESSSLFAIHFLSLKERFEYLGIFEGLSVTGQYILIQNDKISIFPLLDAAAFLLQMQLPGTIVGHCLKELVTVNQFLLLPCRHPWFIGPGNGDLHAIERITDAIVSRSICTLADRNIIFRTTGNRKGGNNGMRG